MESEAHVSLPVAVTINDSSGSLGISLIRKLLAVLEPVPTMVPVVNQVQAQKNLNQNTLFQIHFLF